MTPGGIAQKPDPGEPTTAVDPFHPAGGKVEQRQRRAGQRRLDLAGLHCWWRVPRDPKGRMVRGASSVQPRSGKPHSPATPFTSSITWAAGTKLRSRKRVIAHKRAPG